MIQILSCVILGLGLGTRGAQMDDKTRTLAVFCQNLVAVLQRSAFSPYCPPPPLLGVSPQASPFPSLSLSVPVGKMGMANLPAGLLLGQLRRMPC